MINAYKYIYIVNKKNSYINYSAIFVLGKFIVN